MSACVLTGLGARVVANAMTVLAIIMLVGRNPLARQYWHRHHYRCRTRARWSRCPAAQRRPLHRPPTRPPARTLHPPPAVWPAVGIAEATLGASPATDQRASKFGSRTRRSARGRVPFGQAGQEPQAVLVVAGARLPARVRRLSCRRHFCRSAMEDAGLLASRREVAWPLLIRRSTIGGSQTVSGGTQSFSASSGRRPGGDSFMGSMR
jgi:hypothetical protein